jgi:arsenite efflux membrane protein ArsB (TC 3.A.4.1.1; TC 2.A.45.1.1)
LIDTPHLVTWGIVALSIFGVILRPFKWPEFVWAVTGAIALVARSF